MNLLKHKLVVIFLVPFITLGIGGCYAIGSSIGSTAADDQGNALRVDYQRPSDEALNEFEGYIKEMNMEVTSKKDGTLSASGNFGRSSQGTDSQEIRMKVYSKQDGSNASLVIITEYVDPTSGEYKRASNDTGIMTSREETQTTKMRTFTRVERNLISRYGADNVEAMDSDLTY